MFDRVVTEADLRNLDLGQKAYHRSMFTRGRRAMAAIGRNPLERHGEHAQGRGKIRRRLFRKRANRSKSRRLDPPPHAGWWELPGPSRGPVGRAVGSRLPARRGAAFDRNQIPLTSARFFGAETKNGPGAFASGPFGSCRPAVRLLAATQLVDIGGHGADLGLAETAGGAGLFRPGRHHAEAAVVDRVVERLVVAAIEPDRIRDVGRPLEVVAGAVIHVTGGAVVQVDLLAGLD